MLRNAISSDAKSIIDNLKKVHGETDFLLSYADEKGFTIDEEIEFITGELSSQVQHLM